MTAKRRLLPLLLLLSFVVTAVAPNALAQSTGNVQDETPQQSANKLQVNKIDATDRKQVKVDFTYNGQAGDLTRLTLRENGTQVTAAPPQLLSSTGVSRATVLVLDTSGSMVVHGGLETAKRKMKELVSSKAPGDQMGVVTFGDVAVVAQDLTADAGKLNTAIDAIHGNTKARTAMWDGVASASAILNDQPKLQHNLILVTDGSDDASAVSAAGARGDVTTTSTVVFAMGISQEKQLDRNGLSKLVGSAGGRFFVASQATDIASAFELTSTALDNQYVTSYASQAPRGRATLDLTVGGTKVTSSFTTGGVSGGYDNLKPQILPGASGPAFLRNTGGLMLGLLLFGLALAVAGYIVIQLVVAKRSGLEAVLSPYAEGAPGLGVGEEGVGGGLGQTALLQRAVALTEGFAKDRGFLEKVESKLELADVPLRAAEVLLAYFVGVLLFTLIGLVVSGGNVIVALVFLALAVMFGPAALDFRRGQRQRKFNAQLPQMLQLMAGALRAGFSLMQAVDAVSQEVENPMGKELRRVVTEARLGRELEDALDDTAERTGSADFGWAVMAIRIQREVGGNLAELLLTVADTMVQRERLRREVKALTAEGRISAIVLALLPPALAVVMYMLNPHYMNPLFNELIGQIMLGISIVMMVIGFLWMRAVVQIDV